MIHWKTVAAFLILVAFGLAFADDLTIDEHGWLIKFADADGAKKSIGIVKLVTPKGEVLYADSLLGGLFQLNAGGDYPNEVTLDKVEPNRYTLAATELANRDGFPMPYELRLDILLKKTRVDFKLEISATGSVRFSDGLSLFTPMDSRSGIAFYNSTEDTTGFSWYTEFGSHMRKPFQASAELKSDNCNLNLVFPNPLHPVCKLSKYGLNVEVLTYAEPNTTVPQGLGRICTILEDGDKVSASWVVIAPASDNNANLLSDNIVTFSPHPVGSEQSTMLAFDDIPSLEPFWAIPTDASNPHTPVTSNLLRLLDLFPDIKYTWLILTDGIQRDGLWYFNDWWPPYTGTMPDSEYVYEGDYSCRLSLTEIQGITSAVIVNLVPISPGTKHILGGMLMSIVDDINDSQFTVTVRSWPYNTILAEQSFSHTGNEWQEFELDFVSDTLGAISVNYRLSGENADVYLDDMYCKKTGDEINLFLNAGFENFQPFVSYEPSEPIWANARGCFRIAAEAPLEYHEFLQNIQNEVSFWKYTDRIGLGLHGMHHTPDLEYLSEPIRSVHEFNYYDVRGDSLRMAHIVEDLETIGLNPDKILSIFRFPGHRHTESILRPLFKHNCRIIDQGNFAGNISHFGRLYRYNKMMWMTFSTAWFDNPQFYMHEYLENDLKMGQFCLTGVHYHLLASLSTPGKFEETVRLFSWLESEFPRLHWFKGDELAEFWDELGAVTDISQESFEWGEKFTWVGSMANKETILIRLKNKELKVTECFVDGHSVPSEQRGQRVFVVLPELDDGIHSMMAIIRHTDEVNAEIKDYQITRNSGNMLTIQNIPFTTEPISVEIFDISGRRVKRWSGISILPPAENLNLALPGLSAGVYILNIERERMVVTRRFTVVR